MTLATKLKAKQQTLLPLLPHLIIQALAGTGKTTTLIEALVLLFGGTPRIKPSPQQEAVWEAVLLSKGIKPWKAAFVAFNKTIANELKERVPQGVKASTMHGMGYKACMQAFGNVCIPDEGADWVVRKQIAELLEIDLSVSEQKWDNWQVIELTRKLVGLCKMNLVTGTPDEIDAIASHHDMDLNGDRDLVVELVPEVLDLCRQPQRDNRMDYNDMVWLPIVLDLPMTKYELLLGDETQDWNRCQQALARKAGKRIILVGDVHQAIYGFAGADAESMKRMQTELEATPNGCQLLPLTVTRRCGKAIVREAQKIVAGFEAHEDNPEAYVGQADYYATGTKDFIHLVKDGDMLVCRCNAPLVSLCYRFLKAGRRATIQGKEDMVDNLVSTVKRMRCKNTDKFVAKLDKWYLAMEKKEMARAQPSENRLIALKDRVDCLMVFASETTTTAQMIKKIQDTFTDDPNIRGIKLSSIHKAKGLESDRVFLLEPKGCSVPHQMANSEWQLEQEWNCRYIAITRAKSELIYVK